MPVVLSRLVPQSKSHVLHLRPSISKSAEGRLNRRRPGKFTIGRGYGRHYSRGRRSISPIGVGLSLACLARRRFRPDRRLRAGGHTAAREQWPRAAFVRRIAKPLISGDDGEGPRSALTRIPTRRGLQSWELSTAVGRAGLLRCVGSSADAAKRWQRALALVTDERERRFLERRLGEVQVSRIPGETNDSTPRSLGERSSIPERVGARKVSAGTPSNRAVPETWCFQPQPAKLLFGSLKVDGQDGNVILRFAAGGMI
jgi:hypothetical protein